MANILYSPEYEVVAAFLHERRCGAGLSQRETSRRLGRSQGHIHRLETRQRRVEIVEFCRLMVALGVDPLLAFSELMRRLAADCGSLPAPGEVHEQPGVEGSERADERS